MSNVCLSVGCSPVVNYLFRFDQTFSISLHLPDLELTDFPILLTGNLALLEENLVDQGQDFIFSESIFSENISPFCFLSARLAPVSSGSGVTFSGGISQYIYAAQYRYSALWVSSVHICFTVQIFRAVGFFSTYMLHSTDIPRCGFLATREARFSNFVAL